ncbi:ABC transporter ATP-binding protein [Amycolatopsis jejuensis]|uniref:ABC transporter ATP-binding protein n=1 Tax=Amycolatopsis jejuensis TaxID=330084 RepID=UPI000525C58D|nr:ABC transporter ATP-binding protein [Amycolatopsis jejuensis]
MTKTLLQVTNLAVERRGVRILKDVSFSVPRGASVGLVGETGSGKSMTCRAVMGLLGRIGAEVTKGSVEYDGTDLASCTPAQRKSLRRSAIGMVPQASIGGLDPVVRIGRQLRETVALSLPRAEVEDRLGALLSAVRLPSDPSFLRRYPHELSGGQRQRIMIALALAGKPGLLLADEPTTALDVTVQREILNLLMSLREELDMSMLLVSHDLGVISQVCDWIVVMYGGITVESGPVHEVLRAPAHPYTRALVASHPAAVPPGQRLAGIPGSPPEATDDQAGCPFTARCNHAADYCGERPVKLHSLDLAHAVACHRAEEIVS